MKIQLKQFRNCQNAQRKDHISIQDFHRCNNVNTADETHNTDGFYGRHSKECLMQTIGGIPLWQIWHLEIEKNGIKHF